MAIETKPNNENAQRIYSQEVLQAKPYASYGYFWMVHNEVQAHKKLTWSLESAELEHHYYQKS